MSKVTDIVVADALFSIRQFVDGIKKQGLHLVSRFRDTASLYYVYTEPRSNKPGRPKTLDGEISYEKTRPHAYGKGDDEGKQAAVFHGLFQGNHGEYIHRKINFRQVSERTEPEVN